MNLRELFRAISQSWWVILASILICVGLATVYSLTTTPVYEASATFVVNPSIRISSTDQVLYSMDTLASRSTVVNTFCEILSSRAIVEQAGAALGLGQDLAASFAGGSGSESVECIVAPESNVVRLILKGPSPQMTADLANSIGLFGIDYISGLQEVYELRALDPAIPDPAPIAPNMIFNIAFGLAVGVLGGATLATLLYGIQHRPDILSSMNNTTRTRETEDLFDLG